MMTARMAVAARGRARLAAATTRRQAARARLQSGKNSRRSTLRPYERMATRRGPACCLYLTKRTTGSRTGHGGWAPHSGDQAEQRTKCKESSQKDCAWVESHASQPWSLTSPSQSCQAAESVARPPVLRCPAACRRHGQPWFPPCARANLFASLRTRRCPAWLPWHGLQGLWGGAQGGGGGGELQRAGGQPAGGDQQGGRVGPVCAAGCGAGRGAAAAEAGGAAAAQGGQEVHVEPKGEAEAGRGAGVARQELC